MTAPRTQNYSALVQRLYDSLHFRWQYNFFIEGPFKPEELKHKSLDIEYKSVTASIAIDNDSITIRSIGTCKPARNRGQASELLQNICDAADENNLFIKLTPKPKHDKPLTVNELIKFYERFDFVGDASGMRRCPRPLAVS